MLSTKRNKMLTGCGSSFSLQHKIMDQAALNDILTMIGDVSPEAKEMIDDAKKAAKELGKRMETAEAKLTEIREALKVYATEKGDAMFLQEFELACRMVRSKKK